MRIIFNGIQFGIVLTLLIGPVFFTIIQTSIENGFWKGALVALGVSLSDITIVIIGYFGVIYFVNDPKFKIYMGYVGGSILIVFGLYYLIFKSKKRDPDSSKVAVERKAYRYMLKGFIINGFSPSVFIFWVGTISVASLNFGYSKGFDFFLFFLPVLAIVLGTDILKAYLAGKLSRLVTPKVMLILNVALGIGMVGFGARLIYMAQSI